MDTYTASSCKSFLAHEETVTLTVLCSDPEQLISPWQGGRTCEIQMRQFVSFYEVFGPVRGYVAVESCAYLESYSVLLMLFVMASETRIKRGKCAHQKNSSYFFWTVKPHRYAGVFR